MEWLANHQRSGALWKTAPIRAKRRHPDGWEFNSLSNRSDEVGACTVTPFITAPPHELGWHAATFWPALWVFPMIFVKSSNGCEVGHIGTRGGHESRSRQVRNMAVAIGSGRSRTAYVGRGRSRAAGRSSGAHRGRARPSLAASPPASILRDCAGGWSTRRDIRPAD